MTINGTGSRNKPELSSLECFHCGKQTNHPLSTTRVIEIFCSMKCREEAYSELRTLDHPQDEDLSLPTPI